MDTTLHRGYYFPLQMLNGRPVMGDFKDLIKSSIRTILGWPLGTRYFNDYFGSRVHELLEEPNDTILKTFIRRYVIDSITQHETRIVLDSVNIQRDDDRLLVSLIYTIPSIKVMDNLTLIIQI